MKILFLSFYYSPDIGPGAFRAVQLVSALRDQLPEGGHIEVITTCSNRYSSYLVDAPEIEEFPGLTIRRIKIPTHKGRMANQIWAFSTYALQVLRLVKKSDYELVYGTSARLMTAALSAFVARRKKAFLYLDIRDIFTDVMNDLMSKRVRILTKWLFLPLEHWTMTQASKINLVSSGFDDYFQQKYPGQHYSYFTNSVGAEFVGIQHQVAALASPDRELPLTVLYAGNIGEGQGLHKIIPELAKRLEGRIRFRVIGDGGRRLRLNRRLIDLDCKNVELLPPVGQDQLIDEYIKADILFVHLNDFEALRKVLPSKLFEYAATGKPIWAGVSGYAAEFINTTIENAALFDPCDAEGAVQALESLDLECCDRQTFVENFSSEAIFPAMAADILALIKKGNNLQRYNLNPKALRG